MNSSFWTRRKKILRGLARRLFLRDVPAEFPRSGWDDIVYGREISDAKMISRSTSLIASKYHYASVELLILRHMANRPLIALDNVLDLGTGAGHWLRFYKDLGAERCFGVDLSAKCIAALEAYFRFDESVELYQGPASDFLSNSEVKFDLINAIGVMFHIVDDQEWEQAINQIGEAMKSDGLFIISGHFGMLDKLNVQFDKHDRVNKRLRSRRHWRKKLLAAGFKRVDYCSNPSYLHISEQLPESNLLFATK